MALRTALITGMMTGPGALAKVIDGDRLISLAESLTPLQQRFNEDVNSRRVVAVLSPT